jgi:hypothetical protein
MLYIEDLCDIGMLMIFFGCFKRVILNCS